jgi:hypothetical protein
MSLTAAAIHTGAGVGATVAGSGTLIENYQDGGDFHRGEFAVNVVGGAVEGATTAAIGGTGLAPTVLRASTSGVIQATTWYGAERIQGSIPTAGEVSTVMFQSTAGAFTVDSLGQLARGAPPREFGVGGLTRYDVNHALVSSSELLDDRLIRTPAMVKRELFHQSFNAATNIGAELAHEQWYLAD